MKIALVIAVSEILHLRSQHSCENVIMESSGTREIFIGEMKQRHLSVLVSTHLVHLAHEINRRIKQKH